MVRIGARAAALGAAVALIAASASSASAADLELPDGRGYELVSSAAGKGIEVIPQTDKVHVRSDGSAVTFSALEDGAPFEREHLSARTQLPGPRGWASHLITPLSPDATVEPVEEGAFPAYVDAFAPDFSAAIYKTRQPLVSAPNVAGVANLYRIAGLDGGARTAQLMTDAVDPVPAAWFAFFDGFFVRAIQPELAGASTDLRHVVFESRLRLTADAPAYQGFCALAGFDCPIKLYENADGVVRLTGRVPQAGQTTCDDVAGPACVAAPSSEAGVSASLRFYSERMVSADGRRIFFAAPGGIYVREDGVRTEQIASSGQLWTASRDGSRAFFISEQSLVGADTDLAPDVYMYDRDAAPGARLTLISASSITDGYAETIVGASADGDYVYFVSDGQLIPGEPDAPNMGLYVWHDGQLRFIGALASLFEARLNGPRTTWQLAETATTSRVTPDGRHLLFMTTSDAGFRGRGGFAGYDHQGRRQLYLYSADSGSLVCASCHPGGAPATADASIDVRAAQATTLSTSDSAQALTDDGGRVFFNTADALVPQDVDDAPDAYEYVAATGTVHLLSGGSGTAPSYVVDASPEGDDVFVVTRERLVRWDADGRYDLYDARVGGGGPGPGASAPQGG